MSAKEINNTHIHKNDGTILEINNMRNPKNKPIDVNKMIGNKTNKEESSSQN